MNATIKLENVKHFPVLLNEEISIISPLYGGTFIDCTFGLGGYTKKILEFSNTKVIGIDRDIDSKNISKNIEKEYKNRFLFENKKFSEINSLDLNKEKVKAIVFDLGYSYKQIKDSQKGLSFDSSGELNMRMGLNEFSAKEVINKLGQKELEKIFKFFGEEKEAKRIANKIVKERTKKKIDTQELVKIVNSSKRKKNYKIHSATKVFQALRIFVNKEISELIYGLINATKVLEKNGIIVVVSFHSLEDKIVKYFFKSLSETKSISRYMPKTKEKVNLLKLVNKKPITATIKEVEENPSSRSAKLRSAIKQEEFYDFETDILDKFKYLIDIEKYSQKL